MIGIFGWIIRPTSISFFDEKIFGQSGKIAHSAVY
jgi:hypothetical protein